VEADKARQATHEQNKNYLCASPVRDDLGLSLISKSLLFDPIYYVNHNKISDIVDITPLEHFYWKGSEMGFDPHPLFSIEHYRAHSPRVQGNLLKHYLVRGFRELRNPHPLFDVAFYLSQRPDVELAGMEPVSHYLQAGALEGAEPHWSFNSVAYLAANPAARRPEINPLIHYLQHNRYKEQRRIELRLTENAAAADYASQPLQLAAAPVKLITFYLPQFHPISENNLWWGKGFTEWTNVVRATPQFEGHYQPHLPADLGFYDLRLLEVQAEQVRLARRYGVHGFCFYYYWFAGKRLLESPISQFAGGNLGFPFCLCWANENWTRRWDGLDAEILIGQDHSPEDDLAFIAELSTYLLHPDYIHVDGMPLVVVYRPGLLPDPVATAERWRRWCRENGLGEIYLAYTQSFESLDPSEYGFDAAIEFPPNNSGPPIVTDTVTTINPDFSGTVYDYRVYPERSRDYTSPDYMLFRGVFPSWDNEPRRAGRGTSFLHASPELYAEWLKNAGRDTIARIQSPDQRLVFINAWNEWAEGAHLEPDERYGHAWLDATRNALAAMRGPDAPRRVVVVTHDCYRHGAQYLVLNLARVLTTELGCEVEIVTLGGGPWKERFATYGPLHDLTGKDSEGPEARALAQYLAASGCTTALCNSTVSGLFLGVLSQAGMRTVSLIHELPGIITSYGLERHAQVIADQADRVVFPADAVREGFLTIARPPAERIVLRPQGLFRQNGAKTASERKAARARLRHRFALADEVRIVLGMAFGDHRKGIDLFVAAGTQIMRQRADIVFIWVGELEQGIAPNIRQAIEQSGVAERFILPGFQDQTDDFYVGADVFALTSREDPFPLVVLEVLEAGVPVVAYRNGGGAVKLLESGCGLIAETLSAEAMAERIETLLDDESLRSALGETGRQRMIVDFSFRRYGHDLLKLLDPSHQRISVVAPNYNYALYLPERLRSIDAQTVAPYELIVLDDASKDDSVSVAQSLLPTLATPAELIVNDTNSGSVFRQWRRGVEMAEGDLVWIAEVDDLSDPGFLAEAQRPLIEDPSVVLSFTQSKMIDEHGQITGPDYLDYVQDIDPVRWRQAYVADGLDEIRLAMAIKNTIPNVSGVLFRRDALLRVLNEAFDTISSFRVAGDWATYVKLLEQGRIAFSPKALNLHRRHSSSVTISSFNESQLSEVVAMQELVRRDYGVDERTHSAADAYVAELSIQLSRATS
jgi:glycosyltransferase involved in cell wall biosynthesis/GT2 family glycosyltransferase